MVVNGLLNATLRNEYIFQVKVSMMHKYHYENALMQYTDFLGGKK